MDNIEKIKKLKEEKNAIILAHYYVDEEVQKIADYIGDSFYLAKVASQTEADRIVFAGVEFMGESAKILNPNKKVLMPDAFADCPMAHMITIKEIKEMREKYDDLAVVCYINITLDKLNEAKQKYPEAKIAVHPECKREIVEAADFVGSTSAIIDYVVQTNAKDFIIGTVDGVFAKIKELAPNKNLHTIMDVQVCPNMKKVTLEKIVDVLENDTNEVILNDDFMQKALSPLKKMLELAK